MDQEAQDPDNSNLTLKGFAGYEKDGMAVGAEYYQMNLGAKDLDITAISVFGRYAINENGTAILRYDMYDPDVDTDDDETGLIIAAYDYRPIKEISLIPNVNYFMNSGDTDADIIGYLTFVWSF